MMAWADVQAAATHRFGMEEVARSTEREWFPVGMVAVGLGGLRDVMVLETPKKAQLVVMVVRWAVDWVWGVGGDMPSPSGWPRWSWTHDCGDGSQQ